MITSRFALPSTLALALAACAPGDGGEDKHAPNPPIGYELAVAGESSTGGGPTDRVRVFTAPNIQFDDSQEGRPLVSGLAPYQLRALLDEGLIRLIDVRRADEVAAGMILGAEHIALDQFDPAVLDLGDGHEIVLYCRSGRRSGIAGEALAAYTGKPALHLTGGIIAWEASGEPVVIP